MKNPQLSKQFLSLIREILKKRTNSEAESNALETEILNLWNVIKLRLNESDLNVINHFEKNPTSNSDALLQIFEQIFSKNPTLKISALSLIASHDKLPTQSSGGVGVHITGKYAAGRNVNVNNYFNVKTLVLALIGITLIIVTVWQKEEIGQFICRQYKFPDSPELKVFLMKLRAEADDPSMIVDYEGQLIQRYESLKQDSSIQMLFKYLDCFTSPLLQEDIVEIGKNKKADIVIWGSFTEHKNGLKDVRLHYNLIDTFEIDESRLEGKSEINAMTGLKMIREGPLQYNFDYVIQWAAGMAAFKRHDYEEAIQQFRSIINSDYEAEFKTETLDRLGYIYCILGDYKTGLTYYKRVIKIYEDIKPNSNELAMTYKNIGMIHLALGTYDEAHQSFNQSFEIQENNGSMDSTLYAMTLVDFAHFLRLGWNDNLQYALSLCEKGRNILLTDSLANMPELAIANITLGGMLKDLERTDEGLKYVHMGLDYFEKIPNPEPGHLTKVLLETARTHRNLGELKTANELEIRAEEVGLTAYDSLNARLAWIFGERSITLAKLGNFEEAIKYGKKALKIDKHNLGDKHGWVGVDLHNIGHTFYKGQFYDSALHYMLLAEPIYDSTFNQKSLQKANAYGNIGHVYRDMKECDTALIYYKKAETIYEEAIPDSKSNVVTKALIAEMFLCRENYNKAITGLEIAEDLYNKNLPKEDMEFIRLYRNLAKSYFGLNLYQKAKEYQIKSNRLVKKYQGENINAMENAAKQLKEIQDAIKARSQQAHLN